MRFFFLAKEKKNVSLKKKQVLRSFFFALSDVSLSLSLSLSLRANGESAF